MDNAGRDNAVSIVISCKQNEGIQGSGNARIVEYFYSDKFIRKAGGEAVASIARSIKQALYSGEYKDTLKKTNDDQLNDASNSDNLKENDIKSEDSMPMEENKLSEIDPIEREFLKAENEIDIKPIGRGVFGNIYDQFKGKAKAAIDFLMRLRDGEAIGALHHKDVGDIDLVWGNEKMGLVHIIDKHPGILENIQDKLNDMHIVSSSDNRIVLESDTHKAVVSNNWYGEKTDNWLLTAYEKKKGVSGGSIDIDPEPVGKQNGTAPLRNTSFETKGNKKTPIANDLGDKVADSLEGKTIVHKDGKQKIKFIAVQGNGDYVGNLNGKKMKFAADLVAKMIETGEWTEEEGNNKLYDLIQGTQEINLFEKPNNTPRTLAQAIKEALNLDYNGQHGDPVLVGDHTAGKRGKRGSHRDDTTGKRSQNGDGTTDSIGGIEKQ